MRVCDKCEKNSTHEEIESILFTVEHHPGPRIEDIKADLCTCCREKIVKALKNMLSLLPAVDDETNA